MTEREQMVDLIIASVNGCARYWAERIADYLLSHGVAIPVRCAECKHKGWIQEPCHGRSVDYCRVLDFTLRNTNKTYCSYGERKDNETD